MPRFGQELGLTEHDGRYVSEIGEHWLLDAREVMGGFALAVGLVAGSTRAPQLRARSLRGTFLAAVAPGSLICDVAVLQELPDRTAVRVVGTQLDTPVFSTDIWFTDDGLADGGSVALPSRREGPSPSYCKPLSWLATHQPLFDHIEERAVDYPLSRDEFRGGPPSIDVWARPADREEQTPIQAQAWDVVLVDAHLHDPVARQADIDTTAVTSFDLALWWAPGVERSSWTELVADATVAGEMVSSTGRLFNQRGEERAGASSQGGLLHLTGGGG